MLIPPPPPPPSSTWQLQSEFISSNYIFSSYIHLRESGRTWSFSLFVNNFKQFFYSTEDYTTVLVHIKQYLRLYASNGTYTVVVQDQKNWHNAVHDRGLHVTCYMLLHIMVHMASTGHDISVVVTGQPRICIYSISLWVSRSTVVIPAFSSFVYNSTTFPS